MSEAIWYLPGKDGQSTGPYTANQIILSLKNKRVKETTLCWREGMPDWQPLGQIEPFATELEQAKRAAKLRVRRIALTVGLAVCVVVIAVIAYSVILGPKQIRQGRKLIAAGLYTEAVQTLEPYVKRKPLKAEATYLLAVANVNNYATADTGQSEKLTIPSTTKELFGSMKQLYKQPSTTIQKNPLVEAKQLFLRAFKANQKWREKAQMDLAEAMARIPVTAEDSPARALSISQIRVELSVADSKQLALDLLDRVTAHRNNVGRTEFESPLLFQILKWDSSLTGHVVSFVLPKENSSPQELEVAAGILKQFIKKQPSLKKVLSDALLKYTDNYRIMADYDQVEVALTVIARINSSLMSEVAERRIQYLNLLLKAGDAIRIVQVLDRTDKESPQMKAAAPAIYLEAARILRKNNIAEAKKAVTKARTLNPDAATNEQDEFLVIEFTPKPDKEKLDFCNSFVVNYPESPYRVDVLMIIVNDAVTFFDQQNKFLRNRAMPYLNAGMDAANTLIKQYPKTNNMDMKIFELAGRLEKNNQLQNALQLNLNLLDATPGSKIKSQIEEAISRLRKQLEDKLPPEPPKPPVVILTAEQLQQALSSEPIQKIIWMALTKKEAGDENYNKLKEWIKNGGVLWTEKDIATWFPEPEGKDPRELRLSKRYDRADIYPVINHPVTSGLSEPMVSYELRPNGSIISGNFQKMLEIGITPLLTQISRRGSVTGRTICAILKYGRGLVILRPAKINNPTFEKKLLMFSLNPVNFQSSPQKKSPQRIPTPRTSPTRRPIRPGNRIR